MFARGFKTWCENVAVEIRRELKLEKIDPLQPEQLAAHLGVTLCTPRGIHGLSPRPIKILLGSEKDSWSAITLSSANQDLVIYNSSHSPGRRSNDIMHELAHILLGHEAARVMFSPGSQMALRAYDEGQEEEATWLAGCLLLPRDALVHIKKSGLNESMAAIRYHVSPRLLAYRLDISGVNAQFKYGRRYSTS